MIRAPPGWLAARLPPRPSSALWLSQEMDAPDTIHVCAEATVAELNMPKDAQRASLCIGYKLQFFGFMLP